MNPAEQPKTEPKLCPRCRMPMVNPVSRKIGYRGRDKITGKAKYLEEMMTFCSPICASHEQMSREG